MQVRFPPVTQIIEFSGYFCYIILVDPETKQMLAESLELARENNKLLRSLHRSQRWSLIATILRWVVIVGISVGAFYFVEPYLKNLLNIYTNTIPELQGKKSGTSGNFDLKSVQDLLNQFNQK